MKILHRMILRLLPGPFFGWLGTLMFLLLMQFLIRYLPDIAGKGLPLGLIIELVAYNLAYMVVLAVPMSALLASLMAFGRLAETNAYAVIKNSGVSLVQLIWPSLVVGCMLTVGMGYFNNVVLPEANFRARNLWQDIRSKRPDFELKPGVFYEGISNYAILVQEQPGGMDTPELRDITIYDYTEGPRRQAVIKARRGLIEPGPTYMDLILENGQVHRLLPTTAANTEERYEVLDFYRYRMRLDLSEFIFERSDPRSGFRSDRTTPTADMIRFVDSLEADIDREAERLRRASQALLADSAWRPKATDEGAPLAMLADPDTAVAGPAPIQRVALAGLDRTQRSDVYTLAIERVRTRRTEVEETERIIARMTSQAGRYKVEIHKKFSIALACLIFMLIGAPLGLSIRRGGLGTAGALALGIFMFYWITLVQGEKLADRGLLDPWLGMWIANIIMTVVGIWLVLYVALDIHSTPSLRQRLRRRLGF